MTIGFVIEKITSKEADDIADALLRYMSSELDVQVDDYWIET